MRKILYVASTESHLNRFHQPYIKALRDSASVMTMANGEHVDFPIAFDKHFFSFTNLKNVFRIRKILKKERFDAVLLHTTLAAFLVRLAMIGLKKKTYVLNTVHGYLFSQRPRGLKDRILLLCERMLWRMTDDIAVMNAEDAEICKRYRLCRGSVFATKGMGVSIQKTIPQKDETLRGQYDPDGDRFVCLFVGELSNRKNQQFLIRAAARISQEDLPICLLLAGEGANRSCLADMIAENNLQNTVFLLGNQEPILPFLSIADLYVSASVSEGLPFNVMEAMSCGLPILASATKGQTDLLEEFDGALYPLDDMDAFCARIKEIAKGGNCGVGSVIYHNLESYRLDAVFDENMQLFLHSDS